MDEKLLRMIDLVSQLRETMRDVDDCLACKVCKSYCDGPGVLDGYMSEIQMYKDRGFSELDDHTDKTKIHYTVVDGVMVFCLEEKK